MQFLTGYTCINYGPRNDLCTTEGTWDETLAADNFVFSTMDKAAFPPGSYMFIITGTIHS